MAAQDAFPRTPLGTCELKTLPAGTLLKAEDSGTYFDHANSLFMPLFRYLSSHDIRMTAPVEAQIESAAMFFWVSPDEAAKATGDEGPVRVVRVPARPVASMGARGGYSREHFEETRAALMAWLRQRPDVEPAGAAYAVYWNAPFVPGFMKTYEVHVPVRTRNPSAR